MSKPVIIECYTNDFGGALPPREWDRNASPDGRCTGLHSPEVRAVFGRPEQRCELRVGHRGLCHGGAWRWAVVPDQALEAMGDQPSAPPCQCECHDPQRVGFWHCFGPPCCDGRASGSPVSRWSAASRRSRRGRYYFASSRTAFAIPRRNRGASALAY